MSARQLNEDVARIASATHIPKHWRAALIRGYLAEAGHQLPPEAGSFEDCERDLPPTDRITVKRVDP